ncbi:uncharacterized protein P174DRAFT_416782 [Aspergillus novofumigatus IBT 16806]|uniref:Uncharacterized protein n=1 Tax=Aspergillus novofumigatus (strain IBT 16806) TaxID=1392255 RepID=A0A2I1CN76_ASPN1|nr:uncharacterized protein P174DRAFT_416782 [Aspergillus novofumigatus IBT 16806]PKX99083.1 hypothetical protein P174DRAFT_416782 [Aspergillus novofumigatus IBT 16806]
MRIFLRISSAIPVVLDLARDIISKAFSAGIGSLPLFFKYILNGWVQIDIIPQYLPPYLPAHAMTLDDVELKPSAVCCPLGLLAYNVQCSSMRFCPERRGQDAQDASMIWEVIYDLELNYGEFTLRLPEAGFSGRIKNPAWEETDDVWEERLFERLSGS